MPKIDQLVDATYWHPRMSFLDAFQCYHQITLAAEDQETTAFITPDANYHYTVMPFGLKNVGATNQRMMTGMFRDKIGHTIEVYIDDMAHTLHVLIEYPLQSLLRRSDFKGRIAKWGTRLGSFDIRYMPRNSMKGQVLADFIAEFSPKSTEIVCLVGVKPWKVFVDSASNAARAGVGIVAITPEGIKLEHSFRLGFRVSNNEAEYEVVLAGLRVVSDLGAKEVEVYLNSRLVVNQVQGSFKAKDPRMIEYLRLMRKDAIEYARRCEQCQIHAPMIHQPAENSNPFDSKAFHEFCNNLGIKNRYSIPAYWQSNGQAEATNKAIVDGLKKRLEGAKGKWAEELPSILWAYRTTPRRSTGKTPFSLTFGAEAIIPTEVNLCSARVTGFAPAENEKLMFGQQNLLEEHYEVVTIRLAKYQQKLARRYNRSVRRKEFAAGDLVLRKVVGNTRDINVGKLAPSWEGPYRVTAIAGAGRTT
ncbi:uncharacterized protein LOC142612042 [Castanea sativa]|uniref:uncharacterized protein LOC142612042 n=1 Tax=Castanea sativa TaxID=21020 RepID=UPI003F651D19